MMKDTFLRLALLGGMAGLSGCYYDPGYSYVRTNGYSGDAYYGQAAPVYQGGYVPFGYGYGYGYGYGDGYYGCCGVGLIGGWYDVTRYYGGYYPGRYGDGYRGRWPGHPPYHGGRPGFGGRPIDHAGGHEGWHGGRGGTGYRRTH